MKLIGSDMILFVYYLIFLGSKFQVHKPSVLLVVVLINGVKKQVPQVSFETAAGDLISFHSFGSVVNLFRSDLISDLILFGSNFKIQELSVMLVAALTNSGVKNLVPQFFFKFVDGDLVLVSSYEVADILVCESLDISESYQIMEIKHSLSRFPGILYLWSQAHLLTELVRRKTFCIRLDTCS